MAHLDDLASDFSAIHHVPDITVLSGAAFCKMALRLFAYQSVIAARVRALQQDGEPQAAHRVAPVRDGKRWVPPTKAALQADPVMSKLISFG